MTDLQKPNTQQANEGDLGGITSEFLANWLRNEVDGMVPARVVSYNDQTNRAVIHPIVMMGGTDGSKIPRGDVSNIPVFRFGGGGFFMRFPMKPGDLGWLAANDNDISLIMQGGGIEEWPNTERLHKFSDAMFFPDTLKSWIINGANIDAMVVQNMDGTVCLALHQNKAVLTTPLYEVEAATTHIKGELLIDGQVTGASGATFFADVKAGPISVIMHTHVGPPSAPPGPVSATGVPLP